MALVISEDELRAMHMDEAEARIEIACRLFDAGKLTLHAAMRMTGFDRLELEEALRSRGIAIYRPTVEDLRREVEALKRSGV